MLDWFECGTKIYTVFEAEESVIEAKRQENFVDQVKFLAEKAKDETGWVSHEDFKIQRFISTNKVYLFDHLQQMAKFRN